MTVAELMRQLAQCWPDPCGPAWLATWSPQFDDVLGRVEGPRLGEAWRELMRTWRYGRPPMPADIAARVPASSPVAASGRPHGRDFPDLVRGLAVELVARWARHDGRGQIGRTRTGVMIAVEGHPVAAQALALARERAHALALELAGRGLPVLPDDAEITFGAAGWAMAAQRHRGQARLAAIAEPPAGPHRWRLPALGALGQPLTNALQRAAIEQGEASAPAPAQEPDELSDAF
jgi:hypothetical protein